MYNLRLINKKLLSNPLPKSNILHIEVYLRKGVFNRLKGETLHHVSANLANVTRP